MFPLHDDVAKIATFSALTISFAFVALRAWRNWKITHGSRSLPGPQGLPFIGSVLSINIGEPWLTYTEWSKCYGGSTVCCSNITSDGILHMWNFLHHFTWSKHGHYQRREDCIWIVRMTLYHLFQSPILNDKWIVTIKHPFLVSSMQCTLTLCTRSGTGCIMPFLPYGSTWKLHRKMYHTA